MESAFRRISDDWRAYTTLGHSRRAVLVGPKTVEWGQASLRTCLLGNLLLPTRLIVPRVTTQTRMQGNSFGWSGPFLVVPESGPFRSAAIGTLTGGSTAALSGVAGGGKEVVARGRLSSCVSNSGRLVPCVRRLIWALCVVHDPLLQHKIQNILEPK